MPPWGRSCRISYLPMRGGMVCTYGPPTPTRWLGGQTPVGLADLGNVAVGRWLYSTIVMLSFPPAEFARSANTVASCLIDPSDETTVAISSSSNMSHKPSEHISTRSPGASVHGVNVGENFLDIPTACSSRPLSGWERA